MKMKKVCGASWMILCATLLIVGCHAEQPSSATAFAAPQKAVLIQTGNGTTTVYIPNSSAPGGVERLAGDKEAPACKQCEADIAAYFNGAPLAPKCPVCGASRTPLHSIN